MARYHPGDRRTLRMLYSLKGFMEKTVLYLHGFSSSATAAKARYLSERLSTTAGTRFLAPDFNPEPKDFEYLTVTGMINRLRQFAVDHGIADPLVVASSLGCLVALHYAARFGGVKRFLFLAPVLSFCSLSFREEVLARWKETGTIEVFHYRFIKKLPLRYDFYLDGLQFADAVSPPVPIDILHGRDDEIIPAALSRKYAGEFPDSVSFTDVDSDHMLRNQLPAIWERVSRLLGAA
jgi:pimeloyl-ACP methyl ester carboxylesterase